KNAQHAARPACLGHALPNTAVGPRGFGVNLEIGIRCPNPERPSRSALRFTQPDQAETRAAQLAALADFGVTLVPVDDPPHDGQSQPVPARGAGAAVVQADK